MADRLFCALNGTALRQLDERIHVLDIEELAPVLRTATAARVGDGLHLLRRQRERLSVRIRFLIEEYDVSARHQLLHLVCAWAEAGGALTLDADGKRVLRVVCTALPAMSSLNWLETLSVDFTAFDCPYWEDAAETAFLLPNTAESGVARVFVPGDAPETPLNLVLRNLSDAALTTLTVSAVGVIRLGGISVPSGAAVHLHHDAGVFAAEAATDGGESVSLLSARTPESADDLLLRPGCINEIRVDANVAVFASGRCKGRYC